MRSRFWEPERPVSTAAWLQGLATRANPWQSGAAAWAAKARVLHLSALDVTGHFRVSSYCFLEGYNTVNVAICS